MTTIKKVKSASTQSSDSEKDELQAGQYVHKFNELCRQYKLNKPSYKWKYERIGSIQNKKRVKYYISQDQLGVKVVEKSKILAKLSSVKLAYEEAVRILNNKQQKIDQTQVSLDEQYNDQIKNIGTFSKIDKKELLPALARVEQDIDVFLDSESKIFLPQTDKQLGKNESIESNPIEYAMIRKGQKYFDITSPVTKAPSPLPNIPLPVSKKHQQQIAHEKRKSLEEPVKKETITRLDRCSTLRITSGLLESSGKFSKKDEHLLNEIELHSYQNLNNLQTIRSIPKTIIQLNADKDIEMLNYLKSQRKLLHEANEQIKNDQLNTNYLRLLNLLLLRNKKLSYEIKISSDFGKLGNLVTEISTKQQKDTTQKDTIQKDTIQKTIQKDLLKQDVKQPEKLSERFDERSMKNRSNEDMGSRTSIQSNEPTKEETVQKLKQHQSQQQKQQLETINKCSIVWLCRLNFYYSDCCFTTVIGYGCTVKKSTNNAALKMLQLLYSLIN